MAQVSRPSLESMLLLEEARLASLQGGLKNGSRKGNRHVRMDIRSCKANIEVLESLLESTALIEAMRNQEEN